MRRLTASIALLFALTACGRPSPAPSVDEAAPVFTATPLDPSLGPRPGAHRTGAPSTTLRPGQGAIDCGTFTLGQGEALPRDAARCFVDAASAGHQALLVVTWPTVEGAPIHVSYASGADGHVERVTDSRADNFGPRTVTTEDCQGPKPGVPGLDFTKCVTK